MSQEKCLLAREGAPRLQVWRGPAHLCLRLGSIAWLVREKWQCYDRHPMVRCFVQAVGAAVAQKRPCLGVAQHIVLGHPLHDLHMRPLILGMQAPRWSSFMPQEDINLALPQAEQMGPSEVDGSTQESEDAYGMFNLPK